jgi:hypothetical protein
MVHSNLFATASTPLKASETPKAKSSKKAGKPKKGLPAFLELFALGVSLALRGVEAVANKFE